MKKFITALAMFVSCFLLSGCGPTFFNSQFFGTSSIDINGIVQLGPVSGSTVKVYCLNGSGAKDGNAIATALTDSNGKYKLSLSSKPSCPLLLTAAGGSYVEEADDSAVVLSDSDEMNSVIGSISAVSQSMDSSVSPLTHMVSSRMESIQQSISSDNTKDLEKIISRAKEEVRQAAGLPEGMDVTKVVPANPNSPKANKDSNENKAALVLAGLSKMAKEASGDSFTYAKRISDDFKDGCMDDSNWNNLPVKIDSWMASPQNRGGFQAPAVSISTVSLPVPGTQYEIPVRTLPPAYDTDPKYFTKAARTVIDPVSSYTTDSSRCLGPMKLTLANRKEGIVVAEKDITFELKITNLPLEASSVFSLHGSEAHCGASSNAISELKVLAGQNSANFWIRATNRHFAYPIDIVSRDISGGIAPSFQKFHTGTTSTAAAEALKRAVRWQVPREFVANSCAGPFHLQTIDSRGIAASSSGDVSYSLGASMTRGSPEATGPMKFYSDESCNTEIAVTSISGGATTTAAFYAKLKGGVQSIGLSAVAPPSAINIQSHRIAGLNVMEKSDHMVGPSSVWTGTPYSGMNNIATIRMFAGGSGGSGIQETIDFTANTLKTITSASVTISTCNVSPTALAEFKTHLLSAGLCDYGVVNAPCVFGTSLLYDVSSPSLSWTTPVSSIDTCTDQGSRQVFDYCSAAGRIEGMAKLRKILASKTACL
jgi:hypothetical protein